MRQRLESSALGLTLVSVTKGIVPASLQPVARSFWHGAIRLRRGIRARLEFLIIWCHLASGGSYFKWYAMRMDGLARTTQERLRKGEFDEAQREWLEESGADDLNILESLGLQPHHSLFEFGCGFLRSARHFIDYLEADKYVGNDAAATRVEIGLDMIKKFGLMDKKPSVTVNTDNSLDWANGRRFDFFWSHSVLCHIPPNDVEEIVGNMGKLMDPSSVAYLTRNEVKDANHEIERIGVRHWNHSLAFFQRILDKYGMECEHVPEFPFGSNFHNPETRLMKITLKGD